MSKPFHAALLAALSCGLALALPARAESRGALLYQTHCIACHSAQQHWRDNKRATDWNSLRAQVQQWQSVSMLRWSEADILEVARYLNDSFYKFAQPASDTVGLVSTHSH